MIWVLVLDDFASAHIAVSRVLSSFRRRARAIGRRSATALLLLAATSAVTAPAVHAAPIEVGQITKEAGSSVAIDGNVVFWIDRGKLIRATIGLPPQSLYRQVQKVSAGGGFFAFKTLHTKDSGRSTVFTRKIFRSEDGGSVRKVATSSQSLRRGLYCGGNLELWGMDSAGSLLFHTTTNKKRRKCTSKYSTLFSSVGAVRGSPVLPRFRTSAGILGALGTRIATKAKVGKAYSVRVTEVSLPASGAILPLPLLPKFVPISASFGEGGSVVVTTEASSKRSVRRNGYVDATPLTDFTGLPWRYRACGRSIVRWLDLSRGSSVRAAIEVVPNPLDPGAAPGRVILPETWGSIRGIACDSQRVAYVFAASRKSSAAATVKVDSIAAAG